MNPNEKRANPAISSLGPNYHAIRDEQYRLISYGEGQEELYDHSIDPEEWINITDNPEYFDVKKKLRKFIPQNAKEPVKGLYFEKTNKNITNNDW